MELTSPSFRAFGADTSGLADDLVNALAIVASNLALAERHAAGNQKLIRLLENSRNAAERGSDLAQRLAAAGAGPAAVLGAYEDAAGFSGPSGPKRILVVEDDPMVAEVATTVLTDLGHEVTWRHDAPSALAALREGSGFDLVFSDIVMPGGMSGIELAEQISSDAPRLPILLATGYSNAALAPGALRFPVLAKPYSVQELSRRVTQMLPS